MVNFINSVENLTSDFSIRDTDVLKIQVDEDDTVTVEVSLDGINYYPLMGLKDKDLSTIDTITERGIYTFDINGFETLRIIKGKEETPVTIVGVN